MAIQILAQGIAVTATGATKDVIYDNTGSAPIRNLVLKVENDSGGSLDFTAWLRSNAAATVADTDRCGINESIPDPDVLYFPLAEIPAGDHLLGGLAGAGTVHATLEEHDP